MVGVARTDKCLRCIKKRKRCDGLRPACGSCIKAAASCEFRNRYQFVVDNQSTAHGPPGNIGAQDLRSVGHSRAIYRPIFAKTHSLQPLQESLQKTENQWLVFEQFRRFYLPQECASMRNRLCNASDIPTWVWLLNAMDYAPTDPMLNDIALALALGTLGQWTSTPSYIQASTSFHARALQTLRYRTATGDQCGSDGTLATVMLFGMYEARLSFRPSYLQCLLTITQMQIGSAPQVHAWITHVRGVNTLLELRRKANFATTLGSHLYWGSQYNQFIARLRGFIPHHAHHPIIYSQCAGSIPIDVQLFDTIHRLPLVRAKAQQFEKLLPSVSCSYGQSRLEKIRLELMAELGTLTTELNSWYKDFEANAEPPWEEESLLYAKSLPSELPCELFKTGLFFSSPRIGFAYILCWTVSLLILESKQSIQDGSDSSFKNEAHAIAIKIARSLEFCLDLNLLGYGLIGFPHSVVRQCLERLGTRDEIRWFELIDGRMIEMQSGLFSFLKGLQKQFFRETTE